MLPITKAIDHEEEQATNGLKAFKSFPSNIKLVIKSFFFHSFHSKQSLFLLPLITNH